MKGKHAPYNIYNLVGGFNPSEKIWFRQLGWCNSQLNGKIIQMFQTTNQSFEQVGPSKWPPIRIPILSLLWSIKSECSVKVFPQDMSDMSCTDWERPELPKAAMNLPFSMGKKLSHGSMIWLVVYLPLWKIWVRQLGIWNSQLNGNIKFMFQTTNKWCIMWTWVPQEKTHAKWGPEKGPKNHRVLVVWLSFGESMSHFWGGKIMGQWDSVARGYHFLGIKFATHTQVRW